MKIVLVNIYILADDMGVVDVGALNLGAKVNTPYLDSMAAKGMSFGSFGVTLKVSDFTLYLL